jgi:hypothetical protein
LIVTTNVIDRVLDHAKKIGNGEHDTIKPGQPFRIPDSWMAGECGAQGDLIVVVLDEIPAGYTQVKKPTKADRQLVPGNTEGAKHCLDSLKGVTLYRKDGWGPESLDGPAFTCKEDRVIEHPKHGPWTIPAGRTIGIEYARERDAEQQRERRNAD